MAQLQKFRRADTEFSKVSSLPNANKPYPTDNADNVDVLSVLSWTGGSDAKSHIVYFGTHSPPALQGEQASTYFDPGMLSHNAAYYWRVDEVTEIGTERGDIWSFTTEAAPSESVDMNWSEGCVMMIALLGVWLALGLIFTIIGFLIPH